MSLAQRRFLNIGLLLVLISNILTGEPAAARGWAERTHAFPFDFIAPLPPPRPPGLTPPAITPAPAPPHLTVPESTDDPACSRVLSDSRLSVTSVPPVAGLDGCGIANPIKLSTVMLDDGTHVALEPPAIIRCALVETLGDWVREDIAPLAQKTGGGLTKILGSEGYECRPRNGVEGAKLSEHGKGNAYDMLGFVLHDGQQVLIVHQSEARDMMRELKTSSCARFTTVLGPGSDGFHDTHLHVDLAERHNNYRLCQWEIK
jgi:hypothetical protein